jgi:hypothetical protein
VCNSLQLITCTLAHTHHDLANGYTHTAFEDYLLSRPTPLSSLAVSDVRVRA